jgi:hypothetical protein
VAYEKRFDTVQDLRGNAVEGATVEVRTYPAGVLATIYSDSGGVTPIANPMATDENGLFEYYAADGRYSWVITTNDETRTINDVKHLS